jgi:hypothetical protein
LNEGQATSNNSFVSDIVKETLPSVVNDSNVPHVSFSDSNVPHVFFNDSMCYASNYIRVLFNGVCTYALIDSGADVSVVKQSFLNSLCRKPHMYQSSLSHLFTANETTETVLGQVNADIIMLKSSLQQAHQTPFRTEFHVVKNLGPTVILGRQFLDKHAGIINYGQQTLTLHNNSRIEAITNFVVPPRSQCVINARIRASLPDGVLGITLCNKTAANLNLIGAKALVENHSGIIPIRFLNPSDAPITVFKKTCIGSFECIKPDAEILPFMNENENNSHIYSQKNKPESSKQAHDNSDSHILNSIDLNNADLNDAQKSELKEVLSSYSDVFAQSPTDIGCTDVLEYEINLKEITKPKR